MLGGDIRTLAEQGSPDALRALQLRAQVARGREELAFSRRELGISQAQQLPLIGARQLGPPATFATMAQAEAYRALAARDVAVMQANQQYENVLRTAYRTRRMEGLTGQELIDAVQRDYEIAAGERDLAVQQAQRELSQSAAQSILAMVTSALGPLERIGDRMAAIEQLLPELDESDRGDLQALVDQFRSLSEGPVDGIIQELQQAFLTGATVTPEQLRAMGAAFAGMPPGMQAILGPLANQALEQSQGMRNLRIRQAMLRAPTA